jgi:hypothetical protein
MRVKRPVNYCSNPHGPSLIMKTPARAGQWTRTEPARDKTAGQSVVLLTARGVNVCNVLPPKSAEAPNIAGNYPLGGEKIGPAWRAAWHFLATTHPRWMPKRDITAVMVRTGIVEDTAESLLQQASRRRVLEVRYRKTDNRGQTRAQYRIAQVKASPVSASPPRARDAAHSGSPECGSHKQ